MKTYNIVSVEFDSGWVGFQFRLCRLCTKTNLNKVFVQFSFLNKLPQWPHRWEFCWQWFWWHCYGGDFMMVTDFLCWWQNNYVCVFLCYVSEFLNILNRSPTSKTCHQRIWSLTSVTNIDVANIGFATPTSKRCHQDRDTVTNFKSASQDYIDVGDKWFCQTIPELISTDWAHKFLTEYLPELRLFVITTSIE